MSGGSLQIVSKAEFSRMRGVTRGRVSQWLAEGKIGPEALEGEGRCARIIVPVALQQLRERLDIDQRFGLNGLSTRLDAEAAPPSLPAPTQPVTETGKFAGLPLAPPASDEPPRPDPVEARIKAEKLRQAEMQTERMEEERRERRGVYVRATDAVAAMGQVARRVAGAFDAGLPDIANALAAEFNLPQRDVLHAVKGQFREIRTKAYRAASVEAESIPELAEDDEVASA